MPPFTVQNFGTLIGLLTVVVLVLTPWVWALADSFAFDSTTWARTFHSRLAWQLLLLFTGLIGAFLFLVVMRPRLLRAEAAIAGERVRTAIPRPPRVVEQLPTDSQLSA